MFSHPWFLYAYCRDISNSLLKFAKEKIYLQISFIVMIGQQLCGSVCLGEKGHLNNAYFEYPTLQTNNCSS